jgi:hypothetical protein
MKKNNKGLSTVVTTLIIILLVLVATGIIWGVVNNLLGRSTSNIQTSAKCLDVDIKATKVIPASNSTNETNYNVTLRRSSTGDQDMLFYAKVVFYNDQDNSGPVDFGTGLTPIKTATLKIDGDIGNATKVEITPYFVDPDSGKSQLCPTTTEFEFS